MILKTWRHAGDYAIPGSDFEVWRVQAKYYNILSENAILFLVERSTSNESTSIINSVV